MAGGRIELPVRGKLRGEERGQFDEFSGLMLEPEPDQQVNDGVYNRAL